MKGVVTGDLHGQLPHDNWPLENGRLSRPDELGRLMTEMASKGLDLGARVFYILGDIFHYCNPSSAARTTMNSLFAMLKRMGYSVVVLVGNHDYSKSSVHALMPMLYEAPWVKVVDYVGPDQDGEPIAWAPHMAFDDDGCYQDYWKRVAEASADRYVLGHLTAEGAKAGSEETMLAGKPIVWSELPECQGMLLGHVHKPQDVKPGVVYVGSPRCCDMGERNDKKRFIVADFEAGEFQSVPLESGYRYVQYDLHADELASAKWEGAQGAIVKVNVSSDRFLGTQDIRKALTDAGVAYINSINVSLERERRDDGGFSETMTPRQALEGFFEEDPEKEVLVDQGCAILEEAVS